MIKERKKIVMQDSTKINCQIHEGGHRVWIIGLHGMGDHMGRHDYLMKLFSSDFNVFQYDLRGHGESGGKKGFVEEFSFFTEDLVEIIDYLRRDYRMDRYILVGHSMGSLIAADLIQNFRDKVGAPERLVLSSPLIGFKGIIGSTFKFIPSKILNTLAGMKLSFPIYKKKYLSFLTQDPRVHEKIKEDNLILRKIHSKLYFEVLKASKTIFSKPIRPTCPSFSIIGENEFVVDLKEFNYYFDFVEKSFQVKVIEGGAHELHNEIGRFRSPYLDYLKNICLESLYDVE